MKRPTSTSPVRNVVEEARLQKMRSIVEFFGKGLWKGDLSEMRDDHCAEAGATLRMPAPLIGCESFVR
ncbi:MAG: hypothetical protein M3N41_00615 [Acidobacteriota bacterium]|nr:hypothetical protein [Acidobacteriota bacterium]